MIKKISIRNFKSLKNTGEILLEGSTVLIGSNNTGKTTFLQAIALWHFAAKKILDKSRQKKIKNNGTEEKRDGITITRKEIFALPTKDFRSVWNDLKVTPKIEIHATLLFEEEEFDLAIEFRHHNEELIYSRVIKEDQHLNTLLKKPELIDRLNIAFLPTMSGLLENESRFFDQEAVDARIGEGLTGSVLRNICYRIFKPEIFNTSDNQNHSDLIRNKEKNWDILVRNMRDLFGAYIHEPEMVSGDIEIYYSKTAKKNTPKLEIINSGRGMQQVLLLLSYLMFKPNSILLLDEPDAHLEVLKQKEVYKLINDLSSQNNSQIIAASHSEVVLTQAIERSDNVVAFYPNSTQGNINENTKKHLLESLKEIKIEDYYYAEKTRFILYLEGSTDFDILKAFASKLNHEAKKYLNDEKIFRCEFAEKGGKGWVVGHFQAIKETIEDGKVYGIVLRDGDNKQINSDDSEVENLKKERWKRYEIENYFFCKEALIEFAKRKGDEDEKLSPALFHEHDYSKIMEEILSDSIAPRDLKDEKSEYWSNTKASEKIKKILEDFYERVALPKGFASKNNFYELVDCMPEGKIDPEVKEKLDLIVKQVKKIKDIARYDS